MASLWKYLTELNTSEHVNEDTDMVFLNQGGNSVQVPWSLLKAVLESKIKTLDETLDETAFISEDIKVENDPDISYDALVAKVAKMSDTIINLQSTIEQISSSLRRSNELIVANLNDIEYLGDKYDELKGELNSLPTIKFGDEKPEDILEQLKPKEGDVYIFTGEVVE